ncbi:MAG: nucleotide pyrophosphohydrolase [Pseudomonadota bacterium]
MISSKRPGETAILTSKKPDLGISEANPLLPLVESLRAFAAARDWEQFHTPKNLACALSVEAAELLEHFQWLTEAQSQTLAPDKKVEVAAEAADVFLYLLQLCDKLGIDLIAAAQAKMLVNAQKYPIATARGSSAKYTEL